MQTVHSVAELRNTLKQWRQAGERIAFVPTMGDLHEGHLSLMREARKFADKVVVSIFVNPLQFGPNEDFDSYPRLLENDSAKLLGERVELLFAPTVAEVYPDGAEHATQVVVPALSDTLCGASRPGHFSGVATVVSKLFNMVQPDVALFGEKDFQQLLVIRKFSADLCFPVEVIGVPTCREADGLAMSSRNGYLTETQRELAPQLYRELTNIKQCLEAKESLAIAPLIEQANEALRCSGFTPDYIEVRRANDLTSPSETDSQLVILAAAWLGKARLIDNLQVYRSV